MIGAARTLEGGSTGQGGHDADQRNGFVGARRTRRRGRGIARHRAYDRRDGGDVPPPTAARTLRAAAKPAYGARHRAGRDGPTATTSPAYGTDACGAFRDRRGRRRSGWSVRTAAPATASTYGHVGGHRRLGDGLSRQPAIARHHPHDDEMAGEPAPADVCRASAVGRYARHAAGTPVSA